jgi:hypothetical protein
MPDFDDDFDVVSALDSILAGPEAESAPEQAAAPQATPAPEPDPIQPQESAPAPEDEANASEVAEAPTVEVPATKAVPQPKVQSASSPELEQKMGEATKTADEAKAARDQHLNALNILVPRLQAVIAGEFADIRSQEDLLALADPNNEKYNPDRYNKFIMANQRLAHEQREQARVQQESVQATVRAELAEVSKVLPEFTNPETGPAFREKLKAFAKAEGIKVDDRPFLASDVIVLNKLMTAQAELAEFRAAKAKQQTLIAEATKKATKAPPVQQPGVQRETNKDEKASSDLTRFQKSGRQDDLAAFLQHIL